MGEGIPGCGPWTDSCDVSAYPAGTLLALLETAPGLVRVMRCSPVYPVADEAFDPCSPDAIRDADAFAE